LGEEVREQKGGLVVREMVYSVERNWEVMREEIGRDVIK